jgi:hypothetical protein
VKALPEGAIPHSSTSLGRRDIESAVTDNQALGGSIGIMVENQ